MKKFFVSKIAIALLFISPLAFSNYTCPGKVQNLVVSPSGVVTLSYGSISSVYLCSVNTTYNGIQMDTCKTIVSLLMAAKLSDHEVGFWFNDASNDCSAASHPGWANLANWYFGPMLY